MTVEDQLAAELRRRAGTVPTRQDPYGLVKHRLAVSRRRRVTALVVCTVILLVAGVLGGPTLLGLARRGGDGIVNQQKDLGGLPGSPMTWPARGSLATDEAYLRQAAGWLAETWNVGDLKVKPSEVNVLYAGDVGGRRLVVGAYEYDEEDIVGDPVQVAALAGPEGSDQKLTEPRLISDSLFSQPKHLYSVALTGVGRAATMVTLVDSKVDQVDYSVGAVVHPDGTITRNWTVAEDRDDEPGVVTSTVDLGATGGGVLRVRAAHRGRVIQDAHLWTFEPEAAPGERLEQLATAAEGDQPVPGLVKALAQLEGVGLGRDEITSVRIPWRLNGDKQVVGLVIGLARGGYVEAAYQVLLAGGGQLESVRVVPAAEAGAEPFMWRMHESNGPCDDVYGYVPPSLPDLAEVDVVVDGKVVKRSEVTGEQPLLSKVCKKSRASERDAPDDTTVRLFDRQGGVVWSGRVAAKFGDDITGLVDVPVTTGQRTGR